MTHTKHHHPEPHERHHATDPYWKRAHQDWKFWVAVALMLTAMFAYIMTLDEAVQPGTQAPDQIKQPNP